MIDSRWVVPYNAYLLLRYNTRINVEYCASVKAVKYLYKYIFKGHDRAVVPLSPDQSSLTVDQTVTDEINNYVVMSTVDTSMLWKQFGAFSLFSSWPSPSPTAA